MPTRHVGSSFPLDPLYGEVWVTLCLCLYHAHMHAAAEPQPHEAAQLQWRPTAALTELDFCPGYVGLVQDLARGAVVAVDFTEAAPDA